MNSKHNFKSPCDFDSSSEPGKELTNLERGIIKIQRKYRNLKSEINSLNYSVSFQRDYLMSMINNLSSMNNLKLYQDTYALFMSILQELKTIKEEI